MAFTCLPQKAAESFKRALKDRDIQIADLLKMSTEERTKVFESFAGKDAGAMNKLFEEKLVLKNKVLGIKNFIAKMAQEGRYSPARKAELERMASEFRAKQQERIFSPGEEEAFLNDLADAAVGTHVTEAQARTLHDMTVKSDELLKKFDAETNTWASKEDKAAYGAAEVVLDKYTEALKAGDQSVKALVKGALDTFKEDFKENKPKAVGDLLKKIAKTITDNSIALVASVDNSFIGRQGLKTLMTHYSVWADMVKGSVHDFVGSLKGQEVHDALMADVMSDPEYINGEYKKAGIIDNKHEEQFPDSLPGRIPVLGRVFKASENAFTGSAIRGRTGLYKLIKEQAQRNEVEWTDTQIKDVGTMINSLTARGQWGKRGEPGLTRLVLWAPKMLKANWDVLTGHTGGYGLETSFARKQAAVNLFKILSVSAAIMTIANALKPGSAETDPRSSDFGKIRIGETRFDYTGGAASLAVLASRAMTQSSKSSAGIVSKLNSGEYGSQTVMDVIYQFLEGKTPPITSAMIALYGKGEDFKGEKATYGNQLERVTLPITIQNAIDLKDDSSAQAVAGVMLDAFGINANTYTKRKVDWTQSPGVELQAFQKAVGDDKFQAANDAFNERVAAFTTSLDTNPKYQALSDEDKQKVITKKKEDIKQDIFLKNGFHYKKAKSKPTPVI